MSDSLPFSSGPFEARPVDSSGRSFGIYDNNGDLMGSAVMLRPGRESAEVRGNANLFAASWELLRACQIVKRFLVGLEDAHAHSADPMDWAFRDQRRRVHAPLNAALDKALAQALPDLSPRERSQQGPL